MEAIIFIGIQATGKSTFYKEKFFKTHLRINLDMLKTRRREDIILEACIKAKQPFVVDNTNPSAEVRKKYIDKSKSAGFKVLGYYFQSTVDEAISRNEKRKGKEHIAPAGIRATYAKLEPPSIDEGFDSIFYISIGDGNRFIVQG